MRLAPRHGRFLVAFALGLGAGLAAWALAVAPVFALLAAVDAFFLIYLLLTARIIGSIGPDELRRHAEEDDEGVALILLLALTAVLTSLTAIFLVLNVHASSPLAVVAALTSLPLGWATVHVMAAFHYAHLHYRGAGSGMIFPGARDPDAWDFLYTSFTVGMTAQVSDVEIASGPLRRAVLLHGAASFFYNAVILALAVNAALSLGK